MAYCANCGTRVDGEFCPNCGTEVGRTPVVPFAKPSETQPAGTAALALGENGASALCYLLGFISGIIFLLLAPYNQNRRIRFHAFQSILLSVSFAVLHFAVSVVATMMAAVNVALGAIFSSLHLVLDLGLLLIALYMMWTSYQGESVVLPVIGVYAEQLSGKGPDSPAGRIGRAA